MAPRFWCVTQRMRERERGESINYIHKAAVRKSVACLLILTAPTGVNFPRKEVHGGGRSITYNRALHYVPHKIIPKSFPLFSSQTIFFTRSAVWKQDAPGSLGTAILPPPHLVVRSDIKHIICKKYFIRKKGKKNTNLILKKSPFCPLWQKIFVLSKKNVIC